MSKLPYIGKCAHHGLLTLDYKFSLHGIDFFRKLGGLVFGSFVLLLLHQLDDDRIRRPGPDQHLCSLDRRIRGYAKNDLLTRVHCTW